MEWDGEQTRYLALLLWSLWHTGEDRHKFKNHTNKCIINKKSQCYRTTYSVIFYLFLGSSFSNESLKPCIFLKYLTTLHIQFLSRLWFYFLLISLAFCQNSSFLSEFSPLAKLYSNPFRNKRSTTCIDMDGKRSK